MFTENRIQQYRLATKESPAYDKSRICSVCGQAKSQGVNVPISPVSRRKRFVCKDCK